MSQNRKPDYIVIGAMKCGTSTLCAYLEDHPGVYMLPECEPDFFSNDAHFARGLDWYEGLFAQAPDAGPVGEGSNDYAAGALFPHAAARLAEYNPAMKLVYITRNPVERIVSAWVQNRVDLGDLVRPSLDAAVREQPEIFLDQSLYWKNLSRYRALFPDAQIHLAFMEDLKTDADRVFADLCAFLGVPPAERVARPHQNKSAGKRVPSAGWSRLKQVPGVDALRSLIPQKARLAVRDRLFSQDAAEAAEFSPQTRHWVVAQLRDDAAQFLAHAGKPADFWPLD